MTARPDNHDYHSGRPERIDPATDPLARAVNINSRVRLGSGVCILAALAWALWPIAPAQVAPIDSGAKASASSSQAAATPAIAALAPQTALNLAAFDAPLWTIAAAPSPAPSAPPPPPPPPPLRLQLLGIMREGGDGGEGGEGSAAAPTYKAAVYDPDTDTITVVASGDRVGGRTVTAITPDRIALMLGTQVQTLFLRPDHVTDGTGGAGASGGGGGAGGGSP